MITGLDGWAIRTIECCHTHTVFLTFKHCMLLRLDVHFTVFWLSQIVHRTYTHCANPPWRCSPDFRN